jgi:hypothetical protein
MKRAADAPRPGERVKCVPMIQGNAYYGEDNRPLSGMEGPFADYTVWDVPFTGYGTYRPGTTNQRSVTVRVGTPEEANARLDAETARLRALLMVGTAVDAALDLVQKYRGGDLEAEYLSGARQYGREIGERFWQKFLDEEGAA